jgi:hypothetical protein
MRDCINFYNKTYTGQKAEGRKSMVWAIENVLSILAVAVKDTNSLVSSRQSLVVSY